MITASFREVVGKGVYLDVDGFENRQEALDFLKGKKLKHESVGLEITGGGQHPNGPIRLNLKMKDLEAAKVAHKLIMYGPDEESKGKKAEEPAS